MTQKYFVGLTKLQNYIEALEKWSADWLICFHPDKCHVLTLGKIENIQHAHRYCLNDQVLEHVDFEKDLGLKFDSDLSFDHICEKVKKANVLAGLIHRSFS